MRIGLEQEFRDWATARRDSLRRSAFLLSGDWHLADDLTQATLTRMYAVWPRVRADREPDGLAQRVLVNAFLDDRRRPWRRERSSVTVPDVVLPGRADDVLTQHVVLAALGQLAPRQRAVMVLRFWEDLSVEQTATVLSCSTGTVKSQTAKAVTRLRTLLGPSHDDFLLDTTATEDLPCSTT